MKSDCKAIIIMGVSGSGKTTIGRRLSIETGFPFYDGDEFHPKTNIEKMRSGLALNDEDRLPWLQSINAFIQKTCLTTDVIIACSALKDSYRKILMETMEDQCIWIFLNGSFEMIRKRMDKRQKHFMPLSLLKSQFDDLEIPDYGYHFDIDDSIDNIVFCIKKHIDE